MSSLATTHVSSSSPYLTCRLQGNSVYGNCSKTFQLPSAHISGTARTVFALHRTLSPNVLSCLFPSHWRVNLHVMISNSILWSCSHALHGWIPTHSCHPNMSAKSIPFLDCEVLGARSCVQLFLIVPISSLLVVYSRSSYLAHHWASMNWFFKSMNWSKQMNWFFNHKYHTTHLPNLM